MKKLTIFIFLIITISLLHSLNVENDIILRGKEMVGTPYQYGGMTPKGFDCSGLVQYLYTPYLPDLPRISSHMASYGPKVDRSELKMGDLVFFATGSSPTKITHVAIYVGQNSILHAISYGANKGVRVTPLSSKYWNNRYVGAVRVLPELTD